MAISFPESPQLNDIYTYGNRSWKWNGYAWDIYIKLGTIAEKNFWAGTKAEYDLIEDIDSETIYHIIEG